MFDIVIIGAGIIGSLMARQLSSYNLNIAVLDKENDVGNVTSMANSAIVHSGYDPKPRTLKAKLNVLGNTMFPKLCEELDVTFINNGSLTVAINDDQVTELEKLCIRSKENGVDVKLLPKEEVFLLEPNINKNIKCALFAPSAGIVNPFALTIHAMENAVDNGVHLFLDNEVEDISFNNDIFTIKTNKQIYKSKIVINCAGLHGDKINSLIEEIDFSIQPRKGEYFVLDKLNYNLVNRVVFPLPSEKGKGILVTPTTSGNYLIGPSSEFVYDKDDFATDGATLKKVASEAKELIPNIPFNTAVRVFAGNRPTPSTGDFIIKPSEKYDNFINVIGIESPGLVASPAIANYVIENYITKRLTLTKKEDYNPLVRKRIYMNKLSYDEKVKIVNEDKNFGVIVCNCCKISIGEILDEFKRSVPPYTIKALKKRLRVTHGRCQGGFCTPVIINLVSKQLNINFKDVIYDKNGSSVCPIKI